MWISAKFVACVVLAAGAGTAVPASAAGGGSSWTSCRTLIPEWNPDDQRSECTTVGVPEDYANPGGPQVSLMVSRIRATSPSDRRGVLLINPGGPGHSGLDMPYDLSKSTVAGIGADYDLIGFDPRGVGLSDGKECDASPADGPHPDPTAGPAVQFRQGYARTARQNVRCTSYDPEFIANLSTDVVAEDLDRIRIALGEQKISYYGESWGTALGAVYRSRYDDHVGKMLLDSVMPPDFSLRVMDDGEVGAVQAQFDRFAGWVAARDGQYHLGSTGSAVTSVVAGLVRELNAHPRTFTPAGRSPVTFDGGSLRLIIGYHQDAWPRMAASVAALRDGTTPPLLGVAEDNPGGFGLRGTADAGQLMGHSVLCNDQGGDADESALWRQEQGLMAKFPLFGGEAIYPNDCAGWPLPAQPWNLREGSSALLLVGHLNETVTPYSWSREMRQRIGGTLLTIDNDVHASLETIPQGSAAVRFFDS